MSTDTTTSPSSTTTTDTLSTTSTDNSTSRTTNTSTTDSSSTQTTDSTSTQTTDSTTQASSTSTSTTSSDTTSSGTTSSPTTTSSSSSTSVVQQSTSTTVLTSTGTGGDVVTSTLIVTSPTHSATTTSVAAKPKGFFQNTGAVAGTFTVVGLVALAILIFAVTLTLRRRRARKFDREIAEAAREAATAPVPVFLDDEDDNYGPSYGQVPATAYNTSPSAGYSDVSSHGTYAQAPMSHENYAMSERSGPGPGQYFDHNNVYGVPVTAGAAGIGVARARSTRDAAGYAAALNEGNSPYPAFANQHPPYDMYNNMGMVQQQPVYRGPGSNEGHEAMAGGVASHLTGHSSGSDLSKMRSNGSRSIVDGYYPSTSGTTAVDQPPESYASYYQPGFDPNSHQPYDHPHNLQPGMTRNLSQKMPEDNDAYGGYTDYPSNHTSPTPGLPNPFANDKSDESGEEDSGEDGRRVLKVANT